MRARCSTRTAATGVPTHELEKLGADLEHRVQRQIRVLRHESDAAAADSPVELGLAEGQQVFAGKPNLAGFEAHAGRQDAEDRADHRRLAAPGLADDAENAAGLQGEIDMVEDPCDTLVGADRQPEIADGQDRGLAVHRDRLSRGSTRSRNPSPRRLKPSTVIRIATPGKIEYHQAPGR